MKKEYFIVRCNNTSLLELEVLQLIDLGWEPQGGVSVACFEAGAIVHEVYVQAMIRVRDAEAIVNP